VLFLVCVLLTRLSQKPIHALQRFLFGTNFVALAYKKMPPCPHLNSIEEVNVEEIKRKMKEVMLCLGYFFLCLVIVSLTIDFLLSKIPLF